MINSNLVDNIKYSEGFSNTLYMDDKNNATIGYGTNINKISKKEAELLLMNRITNSISEVDAIIGYTGISNMNERQRDSLYELCYWIGASKFQKFVKMIKAIRESNFNKASEELLDSKLAREYTTRANRLAHGLRDY